MKTFTNAAAIILVIAFLILILSAITWTVISIWSAIL
jgi:hypothetical protein